MERVISQLNDIEKEAERIINRAAEHKAELNGQYDKDVELLNKKINDELHDKLTKLQEQSQSEFDNEKKVIIDNCNIHIKELEAAYNKNKDKYVNDILTTIIS